MIKFPPNPTIVDSDQVFQKFNFESTISQEDNQSACDIIKSIIDSGNYYTNSPRYQTKENIFVRPESVWLKYRMSFLFSVFLYLGREVKVFNMQAWSFMTNLEGVEDRKNLWHHHWHPKQPDSKMLSGIWYLKIPDDVINRDLCGTEMAPNGPQSPGKIYVKPTDFHWLVYPSDRWHRPGIVQSNQYRYILAADVEYLE
jgi:hypothetical protein